MDSQILIKLSNTALKAVASRAVITKYPYPSGVILIGDRQVKCRPDELECISKDLSPFERSFIDIIDEYSYVLSLATPIIPFAPDFKFVFNRVECVQIPLGKD